MRVLSTLFIIFLAITSYGQDYYFINAESGLNVRADSDLSSAKIGKIPFGVMVKKIADTEKELVINDNGKQIKGKFVKIRYNNFLYFASEEIEMFEKEGYVFDGYLKKKETESRVTISKVNKVKYAELSQNAVKEIHKPKAIRNLDSIKIILKNRVAWVTDVEGEAYNRDDILKSITTENGQKIIINSSNIDIGFSEGQSAYYPEYDILVLYGGHGSDVCISISTGEAESFIGNPRYSIPSPKNSFRVNGFFSGQVCISYFIQKNENGKFTYLTELNSNFDLCYFKAFYWISETSFIYETVSYTTDSVNGTEEYYLGEIKNN